MASKTGWIALSSALVPTNCNAIIGDQLERTRCDLTLDVCFCFSIPCFQEKSKGPYLAIHLPKDLLVLTHSYAISRFSCHHTLHFLLLQTCFLFTWTSWRADCFTECLQIHRRCARTSSDHSFLSQVTAVWSSSTAQGQKGELEGEREIRQWKNAENLQGLPWNILNRGLNSGFWQRCACACVCA